MYRLKTKFVQIFLICMLYCDSGFSHAIQIGYEKIEWIDEDASVIKIFIGRSSSFQALQLVHSYQNDEISTVLKQSTKGFAITIPPAKPLCMAINEFQFLICYWSRKYYWWWIPTHYVLLEDVFCQSRVAKTMDFFLWREVQCSGLYYGIVQQDFSLNQLQNFNLQGDLFALLLIEWYV